MKVRDFGRAVGRYKIRKENRQKKLWGICIMLPQKGRYITQYLDFTAGGNVTAQSTPSQNVRVHSNGKNKHSKRKVSPPHPQGPHPEMQSTTPSAVVETADAEPTEWRT